MSLQGTAIETVSQCALPNISDDADEKAYQNLRTSLSPHLNHASWTINLGQAEKIDATVNGLSLSHSVSLPYEPPSRSFLEFLFS